MKFFKKNALLFAWLISMCGCWLSFYFREILNIEPCPLCWYQRMAIFPLALILGMGLYRKEAKRIVFYLVPFAFIGLLVAGYQVLGGYFPFLLHAGLCGETAHCSSSNEPFLGLFTLPMLSGFGFAAILYLLSLASKNSTKSKSVNSL